MTKKAALQERLTQSTARLEGSHARFVEEYGLG